MKRSNDFVVIGFALFAMFFGAGNLIFPPFLGNSMGSSYPISILGFVLTGVGLPLIGIISCAKYGGKFRNISNLVGKKFSLLLNISLFIALGPLLVIPRTAATTYELGIKPLFSSVPSIVVIVVYFLVNLIFVLRPSKVIDVIGKFLTPILITMLSIIIIKGIINPIGPIIDTNAKAVFTSSLLEGYQTMDVLGSVILASIVTTSIYAKGYKTNREVMGVTLKAGLISVSGLTLIYGGLTFLGAQTSTLFTGGIERTNLVVQIAQRTLGLAGTVTLGIAVSTACLTTSIGIMTTVSKFFTDLFKNKLSYKTVTIVITIISIFIASMGVDKIIKFSAPVLSILYPTVIILMLMSFVAHLVDKQSIKYTTYTTFIISLLNTIFNSGNSLNIASKALNFLPLNSVGFGWVVPSLLVFISSNIIYKINKINYKRNYRKHTYSRYAFKNAK